MGNKNTRQDRALSPLSAWSGDIDRLLETPPDETNPLPRRHSANHERRPDTKEIRQLERARRTESADHFTQLDPSTPAKKAARAPTPAPPTLVDTHSLPPGYDRSDPHTALRPFSRAGHPAYDPSILPEGEVIPGMLPRRGKAKRKKADAQTDEGIRASSAPPPFVLPSADPNLELPPHPVDTPVSINKKRVNLRRLEGKLDDQMRQATFKAPVTKPPDPEAPIIKPPKKEKKDGSITSSTSSSSTRVVGTKKKRGQAPPLPFKVHHVPENILQSEGHLEDIEEVAKPHK